MAVIAAMVALSSVSMGGNRCVSARIIAESRERSINIKINAAMQTDRISGEAILLSFQSASEAAAKQPLIILDNPVVSYAL